MPDNTLAQPCYHHRIQTIAIKNKLKYLLNSEDRHNSLMRQGTYSFCEGCHINCYFDPSYTKMCNKLFLKSLKAKLTYSIDKYLVYKNPFPINIMATLSKKLLHHFLGAIIHKLKYKSQRGD